MQNTQPSSIDTPNTEKNQFENRNITQVLEHILQELKTERKGRQRKRWVSFLLFLLFIAAMLAIFMKDNETMASATYAHTAVINIEGEIAAGSYASAQPVRQRLQQAFDNEHSKGVILRINSPGGSPVQSGMIFDEIRRLRKEYPQKRIYTVVEEMCASGAYYIAAATDGIYVDKASIVGSIGVLMGGFGFDQVMQKVGVQRRLYTSGHNKGMLDPFSAENPEQKAYILSTLKDVHQQFIQAVRTGRGNRLKGGDEMFSGLFWTGEKSIQLGLSDGLGYVEGVAENVIKEKELVDYTPQEDITERLARRFGASVMDGVWHKAQSYVNYHWK